MKDQKVREIEQSLGKRKNIFGQVLEEKDQFYVDTISSSTAALHQSQEILPNQNLPSSVNSINDYLRNKSQNTSEKDIRSSSNKGFAAVNLRQNRNELVSVS